MESVNWCDEGESPSAPPHARLERFPARGIRYRVVLLDRVRLKKMHKKAGEHTVPCLAPAPCPFCAESAAYPMRKEGYVAAAFLDRVTNDWEPVIAILTAGGVAQIAGTEPHFGREYEVSRVAQGTAGNGRGVLKLKLLSVTEPPFRGFEIDGHLMRAWTKQPVPAAALPGRVPFVPREESRPAEAEPNVMTRDQIEQMLEASRKAGLRKTAERCERQLAEIDAAVPNGPPAKLVLKVETGDVATRVLVEGQYPNPPSAAEQGRRFVNSRIADVVDSFGSVEEPSTVPFRNGNGHHKAGKGGGS
jgi:hypothetical protein